MSATREAMRRFSAMGPSGDVGLGIAAAIVNAFGPLVEHRLGLVPAGPHPAEALFVPTATYSGEVVIERLRAHAAAGKDSDKIVEIVTVDDAQAANALLARGWKHLGVAAHQNAAPEFHLGRPASVAADGAA